MNRQMPGGVYAEFQVSQATLHDRGVLYGFSIQHSSEKRERTGWRDQKKNAESLMPIDQAKVLVDIPEIPVDGVVESAVSQPLPLPTLIEAMESTVIVADFGSARLIDDLEEEEIIPPVLRVIVMIRQKPQTSHHTTGGQLSMRSNGHACRSIRGPKLSRPVLPTYYRM
ncbi:hypothetical protein C8J56DRAFT_1030050 [Mycena floridula]|nr:hypothetical protein C8J56DRAFT_1030050 [Mycena floridula]